MKKQIRIGISGWRYPPWRGRFYPEGLPQRQELAYASQALSSIELNGSFYSLQRPESYRNWRDETPDDFVFSVKGPRFITHVKRLGDVEVPFANFLASGVLALDRKLGPLLWQLPPSMGYDAVRMERFLAMLPRSTSSALTLAKRHDERLEGRSFLELASDRAMRHAVEVRHPSFENADFIAMLRRHGVAMVVADTAGRWPLIEDITADFVYVRLHGDEKLYESGYSDSALRQWADKIDAWHHGLQLPGAKLASALQAAPGKRDIFCYFDNDAKVHAPFDAIEIARLLGVRAGTPPGAIT